MNRKVDAGPCRYAQIDADVEMEASPAQILDALFANEGQIVTHTGLNFLDIIIYVKLKLHTFSAKT